MVKLRSFKCYRIVKRAYTRRSKYKKKNYIATFPNHNITKFIMGDLSKKFNCQVRLVSKEDKQIRYNAIESARLIGNRKLSDKLGNNFRFIINMFPHQAVRENKMLGGAHADRIQSGMAHSFGKVTTAAAQVWNGKTLFTAHVDKENTETARQCLNSMRHKLPTKCIIEVIENK